MFSATVVAPGLKLNVAMAYLPRRGVHNTPVQLIYKYLYYLFFSSQLAREQSWQSNLTLLEAPLLVFEHTYTATMEPKIPITHPPPVPSGLHEGTIHPPKTVRGLTLYLAVNAEDSQHLLDTT
jgi:hypothetical protein